MIILDTDALGHMQKRDSVGVRIEAGLDDCPDRDVRITAITTYEMLGGAVALIDQRKRERRDLVPAFYAAPKPGRVLGGLAGADSAI